MVKVGHSDKVILYKGTRNLRFFCYLNESLDLDYLKKSVELSLDKFPFFKRKAIKVDNVFYYEDNDKPICYFPLDENQYYLGTKDTNDYLFCIRYSSDCFVLSMFHSISDFYGSWQFFRTIIYHYSILKGIDVPYFDNPCEHLENMDELEYNDPYLKFANKDAKRTYEYDNGDNIYTISKDICEPNNIRRTDVVVPLRHILDIKGKYENSFASAITCVLIEAVQNCFKVKDETIVCKFPINMRKPIGTTTPVNFSDAMFLSLNARQRKLDHTIECEIIRKDIIAQTSKENCQLLMYNGIENANKYEGSLKEKTIDLHFPKNTFTITYPGDISLPNEYTGVVKDIQLDSLSSSDSLRIVAYTYREKLTFSILQNLIDNRFAIALVKFFEDLGYNAEMMEKGTIKGDLFDDKRI